MSPADLKAGVERLAKLHVEQSEPTKVVVMLADRKARTKAGDHGKRSAQGIIALFGPWTRWVVIGYGVAIVGILVGAFFMRLRERRRSRKQN